MSEAVLKAAARFLRPPSLTRRKYETSKIRAAIFSKENHPIRSMVRRKEKSRDFLEIPEARKIPQAKQTFPKKILTQVEGVPTVHPEVLQRRLDFLLSDAAVDQQISAPLREGLTAYQTELFVWERQMRDLRKIYRAQYMQTLQRVTAQEAAREAALYVEEAAERKRTRLEKLKQKTIDLKRRAILADRRRIDSRVNEAVEVARRAKTKSRQLAVLSKIDQTSDFQVEDEILPRDVSSTLLVRQLGNGRKQTIIKSRRMHRMKNVYRDVLERSYDILPEDDDVPESPFGFDGAVLPTAETGLSQEQVADLYYVGFSPQEKLELVEKKIGMLQKRLEAEEAVGDSTDPLTQQLIDILSAAKAARLEEEQAAISDANAIRDDLK